MGDGQRGQGGGRAESYRSVTGLRISAEPTTTGWFGSEGPRSVIGKSKPRKSGEPSETDTVIYLSGINVLPKM